MICLTAQNLHLNKINKLIRYRLQSLSKYKLTRCVSPVKWKVHIKPKSSLLLLCRVNVDLQSHSVCPVGVVSSTIDPERLPPNRLFVVNVTEVSRAQSNLRISRFLTKCLDYKVMSTEKMHPLNTALCCRWWRWAISGGFRQMKRA